MWLRCRLVATITALFAVVVGFSFSHHIDIENGRSEKLLLDRHEKPTTRPNRGLFVAASGVRARYWMTSDQEGIVSDIALET